MSFTSYGYAAPSGAVASINTQQWAKLARHLGSDYTVDGPTALAVSAAAGDRTVQYAAGNAFGSGVYDVADTASNTLQLADPGSGQRWYIVGLRRNWITNATTFTNFGFSTLADEDAAIAAALSARQNAPGTGQDDHPLAAVLIVAGQTSPQAIRDLRCWYRNGGMFARSSHVLSYLNGVGTEVTVDGVRWTRIMTTSGSPGWRSNIDRQKVSLFGINGSISPGSVGDGGYFLVAGSVVQNTNSQGVARVTFPVPFPTGLLTVLLTNGDQGTSRSLGEVIHFEVVHPANKNYFDYILTRNNSQQRLLSYLHRCNFIAIGF